MMRSRTTTLVARALAMVFTAGALTISLPAQAANELDGKTFTGTVGEKGKTEGDPDEFIFADGKFRSATMLVHLVLPMSLGSVIGALAGGYASGAVPQDGLRAVLAAILVASAWKLWRAGAAK